MVAAKEISASKNLAAEMLVKKQDELDILVSNSDD